MSYGLARVNYTCERARARAVEIVGGGSARAKRANERNGSRMRVIMVENSWTRARARGWGKRIMRFPRILPARFVVRHAEFEMKFRARRAA